MKLLISLATIGLLGSTTALSTTTKTPTAKVIKSIEKNTFRNNVKGTWASAHSYYHTSFENDGRVIVYDVKNKNPETLFNQVTKGVAHNPLAKIEYVESAYNSSNKEYGSLRGQALVNFLLKDLNTTSFGKVFYKISYADWRTLKEAKPKK